jgi:UDP-GlcNAc:undecaprenyl-phosphate GlcNAc-1-phosphate transferase
VLILWAWTAILSAFLLFPLFMHQANAFIPPGAAALGVGLYTLFHPGLRKGNGEAPGGQDVDEGAPGRQGAAQSAEVLRFP